MVLTLRFSFALLLVVLSCVVLSLLSVPVHARPLRALITNVCDQPPLYQKWVTMGNEYPEIVPETTPNIAKIAPTDLKDAGYYDLIHWNWPLAELVESKLLDEVPNSELGHIRWSDIIPALAAQSAYNGKVYAYPVDMDPWLMYYRTDFVSSAPATWEALIAEAKRLNGTDLNGDGVPDFGVCFATNGHTSHLSYAMAAPRLMFDGGVRQGYLWDINSDDSVPMSWVLNTPAWEGVLTDLKELHQYAPQGFLDNVAVFPLYHSGRCAFFLYFPSAGTYVSQPTTYVRGKQGTAPLPGSATVYDRSVRKMVPCTSNLCPKAKLKNGELVNVASYVASPTKIVINPRSDQLAKAKEFAAFLTNNYDPRAPSGINPYRRSHMNATWFTEAPLPWILSDATAYVGAIQSNSAEPIQAPYPQSPSSTIMRDIIVEMINELLGINVPTSTQSHATSLKEAETKFEVQSLAAGFTMASTERALRSYFVLPPLVIEETTSLPVWIFVVGGVLGAAFVGAIITAIVVSLMAWERRRHIPRDGSAPFVAFFVTTKNEAAVRDFYGSKSDDVFVDLRRLVTRTATNSKCHAARHLDAHHLLVATTLPKALRCAAAIHAAVAAHQWPSPNTTLQPMDPVLKHRASAARKSDHATTSSAKSTPKTAALKPQSTIRYTDDGRGTVTGAGAAAAAPSSEPPAISIGMVFGVGTVESDDDGKTFVYGGTPVTAAATLADGASRHDTMVASHGLNLDDATGALGPSFQVSEHDRERIGMDAFVFHSGPNRLVPEASELEGSVCDFQGASSLSSGHHNSQHMSVNENASRDDGGLASALELASGKLTARLVTIIAITVPSLRTAPPTSAAGRQRAADACAKVSSAIIAAMQDARASCLGVFDGTFVFGINTVVATARGPERGVVAALSIVAEMRGTLGLAVGCGVAAGMSQAGLVRFKAPEGRGSEASIPVAHSTVATTAKFLSTAALRFQGASGCMVDARVLSELQGFRHQHIDLTAIESTAATAPNQVGDRSSRNATPHPPPPTGPGASSPTASAAMSPLLSSSPNKPIVGTIEHSPVMVPTRPPKSHGNVTPKSAVAIDVSPMNMNGVLSPPGATISAVPSVRLRPLLITAVVNADPGDGGDGDDEWMYQLQQRSQCGKASRQINTIFEDLCGSMRRSRHCCSSAAAAASPAAKNVVLRRHGSSAKQLRKTSIAPPTPGSVDTSPLEKPLTTDGRGGHDGATMTHIERYHTELSHLDMEGDVLAAVAWQRLVSMVENVRAKVANGAVEEEAVAIASMIRSSELFLMFPEQTL